MMRPPGLILAGGQSRRMGDDKTILSLAGQPLIRHVVERVAPQTGPLYIAGPQTLTTLTGLPTLADATPDKAGPLSGLIAGLRHVRDHHPDAKTLLTVPADCPFLPTDLVARLATKSGEKPVVASSAGRLHPVIALWPIKCLTHLETALFEDGERRMHAVLERCGFETIAFEFVDSPNGRHDPFFNINTPEDIEIASKFTSGIST